MINAKIYFPFLIMLRVAILNHRRLHPVANALVHHFEQWSRENRHLVCVAVGVRHVVLARAHLAHVYELSSLQRPFQRRNQNLQPRELFVFDELREPLGENEPFGVQLAFFAFEGRFHESLHLFVVRVFGVAGSCEKNHSFLFLGELLIFG